MLPRTSRHQRFPFFHPSLLDYTRHSSLISDHVAENIAQDLHILKESDRKYSGSEFYVRRAKSWIRECMESHTECCRTATQQWPGRLIYVPAASTHLSLVDTEFLSKPIQYVCLSHCWGASGLPNIAKTTRETLSDHMRRIDFEQLPRTFRESIYFTRRIGLEYIWIDALCIVQGWKDGWVREGARMSHIYSNCTVMIAAESAESFKDGLFSDVVEPSGDLVNPVTLSSTLADGRHSTLIFRNAWDQEWGTRRSLEKRGWALQERTLSPRILHFFDSGVLWECPRQFVVWHSPETRATTQWLGQAGARFGKALQASPQDFEAYRQEQDRHARAMFHDQVRVHTRRQENNAKHWMPYTPWYEYIMPDYTKRGLTFQSDKLPAVSSIARLVAAQVDGQYLAGLWENDIAFGLAWESVAAAPQALSNPSWSWSAYNVDCYWPDRYGFYSSSFPEFEDAFFSSQVELLSRHMVYATSDQFGEVLSGRLCLRGHVLLGDTASRFYRDAESSIILECPDGESLQSVSGTGAEEEVACSLLAEQTMHSAQTACLLLCSYGHQIYFLRLRRVDTSNTFKRWGMATIRSRYTEIVSLPEKCLTWIADSPEYDIVLV